MMFSRSYLILSLVTLALRLPVNAQDSPQDFVDAHNEARSAVGVDPVTWDATLAEYAGNYALRRAGDCDHLVHPGGPYGENLAWSSTDLSAKEAVGMWVSEKAYYDFNSSSCATGKQCEHYSQVVSRSSDRIGCAKVTCANGRGTFIGCSYDPPGDQVEQDNTILSISSPP